MSHALISKRLALLQGRAVMRAKVRAFFAERGVLEVDLPLLSPRASLDLHIELVEARCCGQRAFLHSSPELGMKRLLAEGIGDIYHLSHVFRDHEVGARHNPEFTLVEWYRLGFTSAELVKETLEFLQLFLDLPDSFEQLTYREAFRKYLGYYPETQEARDLSFALEVEPQLRQTVVVDFPADQSPLAQVTEEGYADRFECFCHGMELANGYRELTDPLLQRERLAQVQRARREAGKGDYPLDTLFLEALEQGMPSCSGVAVGFDRLMMLRHGAENIEAVLPFGWGKS